MSLIELARFQLNPSEFKNCTLDGLEPLETVWRLTSSQRKIADEVADASTPSDQLVERAIDFAQDMKIQISARDRESVVMYLFKVAAERENAIALSEIGASLLFCYNHVKQDIPKARSYLERAADAGDSFAMRSLASLHLSGLTEDGDAQAKGRALLAECSRLGNPQCGISPEKIERRSKTR